MDISYKYCVHQVILTLKQEVSDLSVSSIIHNDDHIAMNFYCMRQILASKDITMTINILVLSNALLTDISYIVSLRSLVILTLKQEVSGFSSSIRERAGTIYVNSNNVV